MGYGYGKKKSNAYTKAYQKRKNAKTPEEREEAERLLAEALKMPSTGREE